MHEVTSLVTILVMPASSSSLTMQFDCCSGCASSSITAGERTIDLAEVGAVWWRRPQHPAVADAMARLSHRVFAANETYEALGGLWHSLDAYWINDPAADDRGHRKGYQLAVAQRLELEIPRTLMTNDPHEALRFIDAHGCRNVIYKSFSSTENEAPNPIPPSPETAHSSAPSTASSTATWPSAIRWRWKSSPEPATNTTSRSFAACYEAPPKRSAFP